MCAGDERAFAEISLTQGCLSNLYPNRREGWAGKAAQRLCRSSCVPHQKYVPEEGETCFLKEDVPATQAPGRKRRGRGAVEVSMVHVDMSAVFAVGPRRPKAATISIMSGVVVNKGSRAEQLRDDTLLTGVPTSRFFPSACQSVRPQHRIEHVLKGRVSWHPQKRRRLLCSPSAA